MLASPPWTPPFNKIRVGGIGADLRAYAYSLEDIPVKDPLTHEVKTQKRAFLWYLDMVGNSREAVRAIWAGLVNHPPKPVVLYYNDGGGEGNNNKEQAEEEKADHNQLDITKALEQGNPAPAQMWAYPPDPARSGGFVWHYVQLTRAAAHQGVLVPKAALANRTSSVTTLTASNKNTDSDGANGNDDGENKITAPPLRPKEFVLLSLPEMADQASRARTTEAGGSSSNSQSPNYMEAAVGKLSGLYYRRLDALSRVPLLPEWATWLWHYSASGSNSTGIRKLYSQGCEAYLCQPPDDEQLARAIKEGIQSGELAVPSPVVVLAEGVINPTAKVVDKRKEAA